MRHQTMRGSKLKAVMVAMMVIGLRIGAARRKLMTSAGLRPCARRLRATGTLPHSQTGSAMPTSERRMRRMNVCLGRILSNRSGGRKRRMRAETMMPMIRNGVASTMTLQVSVRKSCASGASVPAHVCGGCAISQRSICKPYCMTMIPNKPTIVHRIASLWFLNQAPAR